MILHFMDNGSKDNKQDRLRLAQNSLLKPDSAKKNFAFQFIYQVVIMVIPLIVSPYLTRTLGGTSLGVYSYTYSVAYYFVTFAMLGISRHGQRIIAQRRPSNMGGDTTVLRKTFWSLLTVHAIASILALVAYVSYVVAICGSDVDVAWAQIIYVISALFDLTWLFYGLEKFKMVAIRNVIIKVISTACIFIFVKSPTDIMLYTLIMAASTCLGQIALFPQVIAEIPPIKFSKDDLKEHIKPLFTLFVAAIAISLYTMFDKTLLGIMATKESVAYYEYSNKIIMIPTIFISIISTVLYPRACQYAAVQDYEGMCGNMEKSLTVSNLIGFASTPGLIAIADQFALLYYGEEFAICGGIISVMCPLILITGIGEAFRSQFIYPLKMDLTMVKIVTLNAVVNLVLSATLIPSLGVYGAVIGSIAAELNGLIIEVFLVRKIVSPKWIILQCVPYAVIGGAMFIAVRAISTISGSGWIGLGIQVLTGGAVYCGLALTYMYFFKRELLEVGFKAIGNKLNRK